MISRHPERAEYDWRGFASALRGRLANDGRGYRALADEIGVTVTDLSRAASGQMVSVGKVFAICDWMGVRARGFYVAGGSTKSTRCTGSNVKQEAVTCR